MPPVRRIMAVAVAPTLRRRARNRIFSGESVLETALYDTSGAPPPCGDVSSKGTRPRLDGQPEVWQGQGDLVGKEAV